MQAQWQLQEAKSKFSQVIKAAAEDPQIITVRGEKTAVILSFEDYTNMAKPRQTLGEFFRQSPLAGIDIDFERGKDIGREIDW